MGEESSKMRFNIHRKDSGWLRLFITIIYGFISILFLWVGYLLMKYGSAGEWKIVSNFKGWELYIASISPGLFVILLGASIIIWGLSKTLKNLE